MLAQKSFSFIPLSSFLFHWFISYADWCPLLTEPLSVIYLVTTPCFSAYKCDQTEPTTMILCSCSVWRLHRPSWGLGKKRFFCSLHFATPKWKEISIEKSGCPLFGTTTCKLAQMNQKGTDQNAYYSWPSRISEESVPVKKEMINRKYQSWGNFKISNLSHL